MSDPPARPVTSLSGEYKVIAPDWVSDEECLELVQALEEAGAIPFRSNTRGGFGVSLALGGDGIEAEVGGRRCTVMIWNRTIGVIPVDEGEGGTGVADPEPAGVAREAAPRGKRCQ